jgi:YMGG-like Gly-zipper
MNSYLRNILTVFIALAGLSLSASAQWWPDRNQQNPRRGYSNDGLSGTWRLNATRGDDPRVVAERATRSLDVIDRQRAQENLTRRLDAPSSLAIERSGRTVTMASSRGPQVTFEANGIETIETTRNGRERRTTAMLSGGRLTVRTVGDRGSDFEVVFEPLEGGRRMLVTRSLYTERLNQVVVARSVYDRVSDVAQFNLDRDLVRDQPDPMPSRGNFNVPDGVQLTARLNQQLSTRQTREGDRFTLNVTDPGQYRGAVIEGVVMRSDRAGRVSGRADMTLDFNRIRMRDGRTYEFAGTIDNAMLPNGERVRVDREGNVKEDDSQTSRTLKRSAIGGAVGALIGAIAGGGKGAAIGAAVGAGAGAGSVFIEGRDDLDLPIGTEIYIRASAPRNGPRY